MCGAATAETSILLYSIGTTGAGEWREAYTARYFNCYRGDSTTNVHAEVFLDEDAQLHAAVTALTGPGRLTLYLTCAHTPRLCPSATESVYVTA